eukprot:4550737-Prymnesium_polylepis.1
MAAAGQTIYFTEVDENEEPETEHDGARSARPTARQGSVRRLSHLHNHAWQARILSNSRRSRCRCTCSRVTAAERARRP